MTPRQYLDKHTEKECAAVAVAAKTTLANFKQIAYGGSVGKRLAERLETASDHQMTVVEILFPERFKETA